MNLFKRGQSSKEALEVGLTRERKKEILHDIKKRSEAYLVPTMDSEDKPLQGKSEGHFNYIIKKVTTSFYDWDEGLPSRVVELWTEDKTISEKCLKWLEWDFCLESLKPIGMEVIQTSPPNNELTSQDRGKFPKILYRHQFIIKRDFEDIVMEVMG